jgi:hypothetical protein
MPTLVRSDGEQLYSRDRFAGGSRRDFGGAR